VTQSPVADIVITREGKQRLEQEIERLSTTGRQEVAERLRQALEMGRELAENAEFLEAKEEQARLEQRIAELEARLDRATVVDRPAPGGAVDVGARVRVEDPDRKETEDYEIVGSGEGDPAVGRISRDSPTGSALVGHVEGDVVEVRAPRGTRRLKILKVE